MHEKPFQEMRTHDVAGMYRHHFRIYMERMLVAPCRLSKFELYFIKALRSAVRLIDQANVFSGEIKENDSDERLAKLGIVLSDRVLQEFEEKNDEHKFDRPGLGRAGAFLQHLFFKIIFEGIDIGELKRPAFANSFSKINDSLVGDDVFVLDNLIKGAVNAHKYFTVLSEQSDVVFIGTNINLDLAHDIDFMVVRTNSPQDAEKPSIDTVDLIEVKSGPPRKGEIEKIHNTHLRYVLAHKEALFKGENTHESSRNQEAWDEMGPDEQRAYLRERFFFLKDLIRHLTEGDLNLNNWQDVVSLANRMNIDPVLIMMRANNLGVFFHKALNVNEVEIINKFRRQTRDIVVPVEVIGMARRLYTKKNLAPSTHDTTLWRSEVAYLETGDWKSSRVVFENI